MIAIVPKPTDSEGDNSTAMVTGELKKAGSPSSLLILMTSIHFQRVLSNELIWVCGLRQDGHQFEILNALSVYNQVINSPESIFTCASKVKTTALLQKSGHQFTRNTIYYLRASPKDLFRKHRQVVYKPVYGYDGNGIFLLMSPEN